MTIYGNAYVDTHISISEQLPEHHIRLVTIYGYPYISPSVNNFQSITSELVRRQEDQVHCEELARMKEELNIELTRHDARMQKAR